MKGKRLIMLVLAVASLLVIPAVVLAAQSDATAHAKPPTNISATFEFNVTGAGLEITGNAQGMDSDHPYLTLVYGDGSLVNGVDACEPAADVGGDMFVGIWAVDEKGIGTLSETTNADLDKIATISVRGGIPGGAGANPVILCGKVK